MNSTHEINWNSKQGAAELNKLTTLTNIDLPKSYSQQKSWSESVVLFFDDAIKLDSISSSSFVTGIKEASIRDIRPPHSIGTLPNFIPNVNRHSKSVDIKRYTITNAKVFALFNIGFVFFDENNNVLKELSSQYYPLLQLHPNLTGVLSECSHLPESATFIADWFYERNYAHWLLDTVPRLINRAGKVICHNPVKIWQKDLLQLYGVALTEVEPLEPNQCKSFSNLILDGNNSRPVPHPSYKCHRSSIDFIRNPNVEITGIQGSQKRALVIKRNDSRVIVNSHELENILVKLGFVVELIDCAFISVKEQFKCFANADVIVGAHGAAMANTVHCKSGAYIFEVFPKCYGNPAFWAVSTTVGANYVAITDVDEVESESRPRYRDISITPFGLSKFCELLAEL
ncbi:glycosyltransferase 61 family protein [Paraglaciecola sp.]|uniref:glycosyltransferase family 61 protein n=1 Tax=Paraglaciecola sp. TaxID=1920173 RepID=UPI0032650522